MRARRTLPLVLTVALTMGAGHLALSNRGEHGLWTEGSHHGPWRVVFSGYGAIHGDASQVTLSPTAPTVGSTETHAGLVVSRDSYSDLVLSAQVRTTRQLRSPGPNPWEVGWLVWHYTTPDSFYALVLKPNGWELTKRDARYPGGQRFLASQDAPAFPVGSWHHASVLQLGNLIKVSADGRLLASVVDTDHPYTSGRIGLYTEDASVTFKHVDTRCLPTQQREANTP